MNYLFSKPHPSTTPYGINYDSDEDEASDVDEYDNRDQDYDDDERDGEGSTEDEEHLDPHSYSWCLMRLAIVNHVIRSMNQFISQLGYDLTGLRHPFFI